VLEYRKDGILPEALLNYLVRLGWSHGDQEIFSQKELIQYFDGNHLSKSPALLNQNKLLWLNQQYLKQKENQEIAQLLVPFTVDWEKEGGSELVDVVAIQKERVKTLKEMAEKSRFFYETPKVTLEPLSAEWLAILSLVYTKFEQMVHWEKQSIYHVLRRIVDLYQLKPKQLFQRIRLILTGSEVSPPIDETIFLLGKAKVLERLKETLESQNPSS
jgi:glutamyl-tRNA synthetase